MNKSEQEILKQLLHVVRANEFACLSVRHIHENDIDSVILEKLREYGYVKRFGRAQITLSERGMEKAEKLFPWQTPQRKLLKRTNSK